jgi:hypothetical protein
MWTILLTSYHAFEQHADNRLFTFKGTTGFIGGNVTEAANVNDGGTYRMQAFFRSTEPQPWIDHLKYLPEGVQHVYVPKLTLKAHGIEAVD